MLISCRFAIIKQQLWRMLSITRAFMMIRCPHKTKTQPEFTSKKKRKFLTSSTDSRSPVVSDKGVPRNTEAKKQRLQRILRLRKQGKCYLCEQPGHIHTNCPKKHEKKATATPGKAKTAHVAALAGIFVTVLHRPVSCLDCHFNEALFGPNDLLRVYGEINGQPVNILLDPGSSHNFISHVLVQKLKIKTVPSDHTYEVRLPSGSQFWDQRVPDLPIRIQEYEDALQCFVMKLEHVDLILGMSGLRPSMPRLIGKPM